ncbi:acyl-CoA thioesterase [Paenibacillus solisilvae]|uniref:Acyl-CoA thioesterase n=1 Tax=Paenibacillus solisilvae TaxID=2486751 RepID=A0ABW0W463_9BACL
MRLTEPDAAIWHLHALRVRYQETDQMGVVFHGNYVTWFEIGRTEFVRTLGMSYQKIEQAGMLLPVVDLSCSYVSPARYDDLVVVCTAIESFSPIRISFRSEVRRISVGEEAGLPKLWLGAEPAGELLVKGGTKHVWVNAQFKPSRLDKAMPELHRLLAPAADGTLVIEGGN